MSNPIVAVDIYQQTNQNAPPVDEIPITPDDTNQLQYVSRALEATADCTIAVLTAAGTTRTINLWAKQRKAIRVRQVLATGTTLNGATLVYNP